MVAPVRVVLNSPGVRALLRSDQVLADLERRAATIAAAAGEGMVASSTIGRNRARASVTTDSTEARLAEATDHALTHALDAGRG
jgi:hypothetical protein